MARIGEGVVPPDGPPIYEERQITPGQFEDMVIGYLGNLGTAVELVYVKAGKAVPITIDDVNKTYEHGEVPNEDQPATPEDKADWIDFGARPTYVTFYTVENDGGQTKYKYDHLPALDLGLAPKPYEAEASERWPQDLVVYLRWPRGLYEASEDTA